MRPWYVEFFRGDYQRVFPDVQEPERAAREAAFALSALGLRNGARVLDLCCGEGRHTRALRAAGVCAIGLDLHRASAARAGPPAVCADMQRLPLRTGGLDAVVNLFSSFGYLESDAEDEAVLREIARVLAPGGGLLLDLLNREHALAGFVDTVQRHEDGGALVVERRAFDLRASRLTVRFHVAEPTGETREFQGHSLRLYTLTELAAMLGRAGLVLEQTFGSIAGEPYGLDSVRLVALARKPR